MNNNNNETDIPPPTLSRSYHGDFPRSPGENVHRTICLNPNRLPATTDVTKYNELFSAMRAYKPGTLLLQETGINWDNTPSDHRLGNVARNYLSRNTDDPQACLAATAHNIHSGSHHRTQWGGTAIISYGKICQFSMGMGKDPSGLGRWVWVRYRGKNNVALRAVSVYCPNPPQRVAGRRLKSKDHSVHSQHIKYFNDKNDERDPRKAFLDDLEEDLVKWIDSGDQLIIGGDWNHHIFEDPIKDLFEKYDMKNMIFQLHNPSSFPSSSGRAQDASSRTVDGIFGTSGLIPIRAGYLAIGDFPGDHHPLWFDVSYTSALGHKPSKLVRPPIRRLQLSIKKSVVKYQKHLKKLCHQHKLFEQQYALETAVLSSPDSPLTPAQIKEANTIDNLKTRLMLASEKRCRKIRAGEVDHSDKTGQAGRAIRFWRIAIARRNGTCHHPSTWCKLKKEAGITYSTKNLSDQELDKKLWEAKKYYKDCKRNHLKLHEEWLEANFTPKERKRRQEVEEMRRQGRVARSITGKLTSGGVNMVIDLDGKTCTDKTSVEAATITANKNKYSQCLHTPPMQPSIVRDFGFDGNTPAADAVLDGTYDPPSDIDPTLQTFLQHCKRPPSVPPDPPCPRYVTTKDHIQAWRKAKEWTQAGISGLHFGMFKANALDPDLAALDASSRNISYATGFVYERYKKGLNAMLLKKPGNYWVNKLRTILLLEADQNMNYKKLSRDVMWFAELHDLLVPENYGGRKHHRSIELSLNHRLTCDILRCKKKAAILPSTDAKGCFDRIVHLLVFICLRRLGLPSAPILAMIHAIQTMTHYVRTAFGDSEDSYGYDPNLPPLMGLLQGNGASGTGWQVISSIIVDIMREAGFGLELWSAISKEAIRFVCFNFVDDATLTQGGPTNETSGEDILSNMQAVLNLWESALRATGGAIAHEKSYWHLIDFKYSDGRWSYRSKEEVPGDLTLPQGDNRTPVVIERLDVHESKELLGLMIRPDGQEEDQVQHLLKKTKKWAETVRVRKIRKSDAWYSMTRTILKTVEYPLMATTMNRDQLDTIIRPILHAGLPKSGIQKYMPRAIVHGSLRVQGINFPHPFSTQTVQHIQAILRHGSRHTMTGKLLRNLMEAHALEIGSGTPFWDLPYDTWQPITTWSWITQTWKEISSSPLSLKGPLPLPQLQRDNDVFLMDALVQAGVYTNHQLSRLNNCRMHLRIVTLADACSANGQSFSMRTCLCLREDRYSPYDWPRTYRPSSNDQDLWRAALKHFCQPYSNDFRLSTPLGSWKEYLDSKWQWWYSPSSNNIFQQHSNDTWTQWEPQGRHWLTSNSIPCPLPLDLCRADTHLGRHTNHVTLQGHSLPFHMDPPPESHLLSLQDQLNSLPATLQWAVHHCSIPGEGRVIAEAIKNASAFAVSDASLKNCFGTSAFVIEGHNSIQRVLGINIVPGPIEDGDSYRCELAGLIGIVTLAQNICQFHSIAEGKIKIHCDNISTLRIFEPFFIPEPSQDSFDLVSCLHSLLRQCPFTLEVIHVKGHALKHKTWNKLSRAECLNEEMDDTAKAYWNHLLYTGHPMTAPHIHVYKEGWTLWNNHSKIPCAHHSHIYHLLEDQATIDYWTSPHHLQAQPRIPPEAIQHVDWEACEDNMKALGLSRRLWCSKHGSENCGVGTTLAYWGKQPSTACPRCGEPETTTHVLLCAAENADEPWHENISHLETYLSDSYTCPSITWGLLSRIQQFRTNTPLLFLPATSLEVQYAIQAQDRIGWKNLLEGIPAKQWTTAQQRYYRSQHIHHITAKKWMKGLLKHLHTLAWSQWDHRNKTLHHPD